MVSVIAGAIVAGTTTGTFAAGGAGAIALVAAASIVDSTVLMPALAGDGPDALRNPRLADVPVGSNDPGAPRIWAIGQRVRVPTHVLWQDDKVIESQVGGGGGIFKRGTDVNLRRTYFDCALALNDRYTQKLVQLIGNGKLLVWADRKTVFVTSANITVTPEVSPDTGIIVSMSDTLDPDFADKFRSGDYVKLANFTMTAGGDPVENGWWSVFSVTPHGTSASSMILSPASGQDNTNANAVSDQFPVAEIGRADDVVLTDQDATLTPSGPLQQSFLLMYATITQVDRTLTVGMLVRVSGLLYNGQSSWFDDYVFEVFSIAPSTSTRYELFLKPVQTGATVAPFATYTPIASDHLASITPMQTSSAFGYFPADFDPVDHYNPGSDEQDKLPLMTDRLGAANVSAYRGVAVQGIDDFYVNDFGSQLPFSLEALIDVDPGMRWPEAFETVCKERAGIPAIALDTSGVTALPFDGGYIRGASTAGIALQPMLIARQVVTQERNGVIAFFEIPNADVVAIENSASGLSHMGARVETDPDSGAKYTRTNPTVEELSTSVGVRHQDPDNNYADGYQFFGLRAPASVSHRKESELNLNTLVLSRREARNLAATTLKREWINATQFQFQLPICYLHLLENDIVTFTDDDGEAVTCRIVKREVGANFLVLIDAVQEVLDNVVAGSPVQPGFEDSQSFPSPYPQISDVVVVQSKALGDAQSVAPGVYLGVPQIGPSWVPATIYQSTSVNPTWLPVVNVASPTIIGTIDDAWPADPTAFPSGKRWEDGAPAATALGFTEETQDVTIPWGTLTSRSEAEVQAGRNWAAVYDAVSDSWEIVGFTDVTPGANPGDYSIKIIRRGLRGSWTASMNEKPAGSQFVLLEGMAFHELPGNRAGDTVSFRAVPVNGDIDLAPAKGVVFRKSNVTPGPTRSVTRTNNSPTTGDVTFSIDLRGFRTNETETDSSEAPMRETGEHFVVSFYDPAGLNVMRRKRLRFEGSGLSLLRDRKVTYTSAEQTADGYSTPGSDPVWLSIQQVGEYGAGETAKFQMS